MRPLKNVLNIGISKRNSESLNRKIKLNNLIIIFVCIACLGYVPMHLYFKLYTLMSITMSIFCMAISCFFLQAYKKHLQGFILLTFSMLVLMTLTSMAFGLFTNFHFFLLCICMTTIVFFDEMKLLRYFIFALSLLGFFALLFLLPVKTAVSIKSVQLTTVLTIYGYFNYFILFAFTTLFFTAFVRQNSAYQKRILNQNAILENKNSQINDSLRYAKHIQSAILPSLSDIKNYLSESFILYRPKDIVAGDFYWMHPLNSNEVLFAAADSTGHGVPGAMVSVVCTNSLNQAVKEFGLTDPGQILDKVRELVTDFFQHSDTDEITDGMDISLCLIDKEKRSIKWAGANSPLWVIRENSDELTIIKPNKQAVAKTDNPLPFTTHHLQLNQGDCFYLFTDGYADQFGGSSSKKYMQKRIKKLLLSIYKKTMIKQKGLITDNLLHWMGNLEQVDDICFIGVKM
ncbi:hypothetical protein CNR22_12230 [Sphingobacteriaceae bacterium]|nr:hypothetical protein CNR22_12230 [Sphingobacteriaceae bacterium]